MPRMEQEPKNNQPNDALEKNIKEIIHNDNFSRDEKAVEFSRIIREAMKEIDEWGKQEIKKHEIEFMIFNCRMPLTTIYPLL